MLYNVVLVSAVQPSESAIYIHVSPPSWTSLPLPSPIPPISVITEHRAELPVLYSRFPLAIDFTHGSVRLEIEYESHLAKIKMLVRLRSFLEALGENLFPASSGFWRPPASTTSALYESFIIWTS